MSKKIHIYQGFGTAGRKYSKYGQVVYVYKRAFLRKYLTVI